MPYFSTDSQCRYPRENVSTDFLLLKKTNKVSVKKKMDITGKLLMFCTLLLRRSVFEIYYFSSNIFIVI